MAFYHFVMLLNKSLSVTEGVCCLLCRCLLVYHLCYTMHYGMRHYCTGCAGCIMRKQHRTFSVFGCWMSNCLEMSSPPCWIPGGLLETHSGGGGGQAPPPARCCFHHTQQSQAAFCGAAEQKPTNVHFSGTLKTTACVGRCKQRAKQ